MSSDTARRMVLVVLIVALVAAVYQGSQSGQGAVKIYKRTWGVLILAAGAGILADFAPAIVGPYMLLVLLGVVMRNKALGNLLGEAQTAAQPQTGG